jgi:hypothetical protein
MRLPRGLVNVSVMGEVATPQALGPVTLVSPADQVAGDLGVCCVCVCVWLLSVTCLARASSAPMLLYHCRCDMYATTPSLHPNELPACACCHTPGGPLTCVELGSGLEHNIHQGLCRQVAGWAGAGHTRPACIPAMDLSVGGQQALNKDVVLSTHCMSHLRVFCWPLDELRLTLSSCGCHSALIS